MCQKSLSRHTRLYCKMLIASRTNRIVMHKLRPSCSNAPLCYNLLSGQIRSYYKMLIASRTNRIAMPMRLCVKCRRLDKSDRIGLETSYVFHCTAVSSSDIFETAVSISRTKNDWREVQYFSKAQLKLLFRKYPMMKQWRSETHSTSLYHYDLICLDNDV